MNTYTYTNSEDVTNDYNDKCPQHGTSEKKEYTFDGNGYSQVITLTSRTCTVKINGWNVANNYTSYQKAAGETGCGQEKARCQEKGSCEEKACCQEKGCQKACG